MSLSLCVDICDWVQVPVEFKGLVSPRVWVIGSCELFRSKLGSSEREVYTLNWWATYHSLGSFLNFFNLWDKELVQRIFCPMVTVPWLSLVPFLLINCISLEESYDFHHKSYCIQNLILAWLYKHINSCFWSCTLATEIANSKGYLK